MEREIVEGITIDTLFAKDLDDGISVDENNESYILRVSIADVASMINLTDNYELYKKALRYIQTRYSPHAHRPMIPFVFSEEHLSLLPEGLRPTITFTLTISKVTFDVTKFAIAYTRFRNIEKLSYHKADTLMIRGMESKRRKRMYSEKVIHTVRLIDVLGQGLLKRRQAKGAMVFYHTQKGWYLNEEGQKVSIKKDEKYRSYATVEELMILVNTTVTEFVARQNIPMLFRNQVARVHVPEQRSFFEHLQTVVLYPNEHQLVLLGERLKLMFHYAEYGTRIEGHHALSVIAYGHWTSPIRRVADLVNHIILRAFLLKAPEPYSREQLQEIAEYINAGVEKTPPLFKQKMVQEINKETPYTSMLFENNNNALSQEKVLTPSTQEEIDTYKICMYDSINKKEIISGETALSISKAIHKEILMPTDFFSIFFTPYFRVGDVRKQAFDFLSKNPKRIKEIYEIAKSKNILCDFKPKIVPFKFKSKVIISVSLESIEKGKQSILIEGDLCTGTEKATYDAHLKLLEEIIKINTSDNLFDEVNLPEVLNKDEYVSALQKYARAVNVEPQFSYEEKEENSIFQIMATCVFPQVSFLGPFSETGEWARNKKQSRRSAAEAVYKKIKEKLELGREVNIVT